MARLTSAEGGRLVVQTWLGTRLVLVLVALLVARSTHRSAEDLLANWDVRHFFAIARDGYLAPHDIAFFPGWPLLLRAFAAGGVPPLVAGIGLALVASALAAWALFRLGGAVPAIAWLLLPTTVFTLVPYTEAPFCAAAFWAWERARSGCWGAAAGLAAVACSMRVSGLFLVVALVVMALIGDGPRTNRLGPRSSSTGPAEFQGLAVGLTRSASSAAGPTGPASSATRSAAVQVLSKGRALAWLLLPAGVLVGYAVYLYVLTGSWLAWYSAQTSGWARGFTDPWTSLVHTWEAASSTAFPSFPEWSWVFRAELGSMALGAVTTLVCLMQRRWAQATWVGLQVAAFSVSYWFFSVNRAVLLWFPLLLLLGDAFDSPAWRGRTGVRAGLAWAFVLVCLGGMAFWAWLFYTGRWAS